MSALFHENNPEHVVRLLSSIINRAEFPARRDLQASGREGAGPQHCDMLTLRIMELNL